MTEIRLDKVNIPKVKKTKEGFLKGDAIVTACGVFEYINLDGSKRYELRHPDDVYLSDSLNSIKSIPITDDHPTELVHSDNAHLHLVGMTGETVEVNNDGFIVTSLTITHKDGINSINKGKKELSLGYTLELVPESGTYNGKSYTHRQTNINYNHLSIVKEARAGRAARLNMDGKIEIEDINLTKEKTMEIENLKNRLDGIENKIQANKESINFDEMQKTLGKKDAEIDQLKKENEQLKLERTDSVIANKVNHRLNILLKASKVINVDSLKNESDRKIMEAVIKNSDPSINLDDKHDSYIEGKFDTIIEFNANKDANKSNIQMPHLMNNQDTKPETINTNTNKRKDLEIWSKQLNGDR